MKRRDARRQCRERRAPARSRRHFEDRAGSIADEQRAVRRERQAARDAEVGRKQLGAAVVVQPVHRALEAARHVELPVRRSTAMPSGSTTPDEKRLARAARRHAEDRHRHLLPPRAAVGDVTDCPSRSNTGLSTWCRPVATRRADTDDRRVVDAPSTWTGTRRTRRWNDDAEFERRGEHDARRLRADADLWQRRARTGNPEPMMAMRPPVIARPA